MLSDFDVTIIGLGPVGSFAALLMENRGLKVPNLSESQICIALSVS